MMLNETRYEVRYTIKDKNSEDLIEYSSEHNNIHDARNEAAFVSGILQLPRDTDTEELILRFLKKKGLKHHDLIKYLGFSKDLSAPSS